MKEQDSLLKNLARLGNHELRKQYKKCLAGDLSNPVSPSALFLMLQAGYITPDDFSFIVSP